MTIILLDSRASGHNRTTDLALRYTGTPRRLRGDELRSHGANLVQVLGDQLTTSSSSGCGGRSWRRCSGALSRSNCGVLEDNCSWAPWLSRRLDEHYEMSAAYDHPDLKMEPSEDSKRQCYLSAECDEEPAEIVSKYGLEDNIVFLTDYPHADSKYPGSVDQFLQMPLSD